MRPLDRRFLVGVAIVSAILLVLGLVAVDRPLAEWVRASGVENAPAIVWLQNAIETIVGRHVSRWLFGCVALAIGIVVFSIRRDAGIGRVLILSALVQLATTVVMLAGKDGFGRLRPNEVLAHGDWSHAWFAGGVSFPSGHLAFFAGFFVPFAAGIRNAWLRAAVLGLPIFIAIARIDVSAHFLSDVAASTLLAALLSLLAAALAARVFPRAAAR
ncbi:MAG TPA: phosphatase PAP2 family protein [Rhodanobacteraceae bacterium]|nr:phosphatase PAP2 family protein [Rhodanobacteraceae bacterium]